MAKCGANSHPLLDVHSGDWQPNPSDQPKFRPSASSVSTLPFKVVLGLGRKIQHSRFSPVWLKLDGFHLFQLASQPRTNCSPNRTKESPALRGDAKVHASNGGVRAPSCPAGIQRGLGERSLGPSAPHQAMETRIRTAYALNRHED